MQVVYASNLRLPFVTSVRNKREAGDDSKSQPQNFENRIATFGPNHFYFPVFFWGQESEKIRECENEECVKGEWITLKLKKPNVLLGGMNYTPTDLIWVA